MNTIGTIIYNARKQKSLTQEELAELSQVNLRTIQRIENNENLPRETTLKLICNVLEIDLKDSYKTSNYYSIPENSKRFLFINKILNGFFLVIINALIIFCFGLLSIDSFANLNSNFGALLLSFFVPYFIVSKTAKMNNVERFLKFGFGMFIYGIIILGLMIKHDDGAGLPLLFVSGIYLIVLFYGGNLVSSKDN